MLILCARGCYQMAQVFRCLTHSVTRIVDGSKHDMRCPAGFGGVCTVLSRWPLKAGQYGSCQVVVDEEKPQPQGGESS